ncbi:MAG TPA: type II toxin-antitoxin system VapC family toxin [Bryobacteraceae bacterium]|nr:type II toxin-antitoxin system VapC family toxin [Bryobacteraceae bacterium]
MVILDTNVLLESLRPCPSPSVAAWFQATHRSSIYTTSITMAEVLCGIAVLPDGGRKRALMEAAVKIFEVDLADRVLDFTGDAARAYVRIMAARRAAGRPMSSMDAMIAAIAVSHKATLATRNTRDFEGCGVRLVNPFGG